MCVQGQGVYGNSPYAAQFRCKLKTALKNQIYLKKNRWQAGFGLWDHSLAMPDLV